VNWWSHVILIIAVRFFRHTIFMPPRSGGHYVSLCPVVCPVVPMSCTNMDSSAGRASPIHACSSEGITWKRGLSSQVLSRVSTLTHAIDIVIVSVCPSVCPSVRCVPVFYENALTTYCHSFFTMRYPNHSSFISIKHLREIPMGSPPAEALNTGGV